jgi:branched-chain amino acid transport system ATP-binding protein
VTGLELSGITAGYGRVQVLHEVGVNVAPGEVVALIGPNGAGKSTLLRAATGMIPLRGGRILLGERDLTGASIETIATAGIAHVPEGRRLFPGLTVRENLRLGGWHSRNRDLGPVVELFPQLGARLDQVAGSLSGGEQQMCAIGRALMSRPAMLLVEQDAGAALEVAARAYVLENGRITVDGPAGRLADDPRVREAYLGVA